MFLYGESGVGKSSLINAGLIPAVEAEGFRAERLRVQPRRGEELVVERIPETDDASSFLRSSLADDGDGSARIVLAADTLHARLAALSKEERSQRRPLLIFDQFEELVTLFEEAPPGEALEEALASQRRVVDALVAVLQDETLRVKLLFGFREDYLAKIKKLLERCPELVSRSLRLTPLSTDALPRIIRGPFDDFPGAFERELSPELAERLAQKIERRSALGAINLSEVQIVCLRLWESDDPAALLEAEGVQGVLEDYLEESLAKFAPEVRDAAVALLSQMVTSSGARNVISAHDLFERVQAEDPELPAERLAGTLEALERETRLVRRERRRDIDLYEISSEFLVPWIGRQRAERLKVRERAELDERRRRQYAAYLRNAVAVVAAVLVAALALTVLALVQARHERDTTRSVLAAREATQLLDTDPEGAVFAAHRARSIEKTDEAEEALRSALVASGRRAVLRGHEGGVRQANFSADGERVVTAGEDGTARIWNAQTGNPITSVETKNPVYAAAFSDDVNRIVTASADGVARLWNVTTKEASELRGHTGPVLGVAFSRDGAHVVTAGADGTARIWDVGAKSSLTLRGHTGPVVGASFSPNGARVVTAGADGRTIIWETRSQTQVMTLGKLGDSVNSAAFSPDGTRVATAGGDGMTRIWDTRTGKLATAFATPGRIVYSAAFSPDGGHVVTAADDGILRIWETRTRMRTSVTALGKRSGAEASWAAFSPDGTRVVSAGDDGTARVWASGLARNSILISGRPLSRGHRRLLAAAFSADGRWIATATDDAATSLWSNDTGRWSVRRALAKGPAVVSASFSSDSRRLLTAGGTDWRIWDVATARATRTVRSSNGFSMATFNPTAERVVAVGAGVTVFDARTGSERIQIIGPDANESSAISSAAFSSDGAHLVTVTGTRVTLWDVGTGARVAALPPSQGVPVSAAFSPRNGLVTAHANGTAMIWNVDDVRRPRLIAVLSGHQAAISTATFSRDGKFVVTASENGTGAVWEAGSGRLLSRFYAEGGAVKVAELSGAFSPDRSPVVLTASEDGTVRRHSCEPCLPIEDLIRLGNWTDEELSGDA